MNLNLGHIAYLNCVPFFHFLRENGFEGTIRQGVPAELNGLLAAGQIDASPSSSYEYARNFREYLLLPGQSISSTGPVKSVLLFSARPIEELSGERFALTGESATSVHLLQILLREYLGYEKVDCYVPDEDVETVIESGRPALLIGDRALKAARKVAPGEVYDLGELWQHYTGLPFVFALWIVRRDAAAGKREALQSLSEQLRLSRRQAFGQLQQVAECVPERSWMEAGEMIDYWRCMSYDLTEAHMQGLKLYFDLLFKYGFLQERPSIEFFG